MHELAVLFAADVRAIVNRISRGAWRDRAGTLAGFVIAGAFGWGAFAFFARVFGGIRGLADVEALLPGGLLVLTGQLVAMTALTAFAALFASAVVAVLAVAVQARDLALILALPVPRTALIAHRLARACAVAGAPIALVLLPAAAALGRVWGHLPLVLVMACVSVTLLVTGTVAVAMVVLMVLLRLFPAGRVAQLTTSLSALAIAALVGVLRAVRPERLFNPASGADLLEALRSLRLPSLDVYPSTWMAASWVAAAGGRAWLLPLTSLVGFAAVGGAAAWVAGAWHRRAWIRVREAPPPALPGLRITERLGAALAEYGSAPSAAVMRCELAALTRDPAQWTQVALLAGLVVLYVYNLTLIPGDQHLLGPLLALLNVGVAGLVIAAVAVRLGLPSVSRDGPSRWLVECSPLPARQRLVAKTAVVSVGLVLLGGGLTAAACALLRAPLSFKVQAIAAVVMMGPVLAALAVGFGARFPRYDLADPVQIAISSGGLACFAVMLGYVGAMTVLTARPVLAWYVRWLGAAAPVVAATPWAAAGLQVALSLAVGAGAIRWGANALER